MLLMKLRSGAVSLRVLLSAPQSTPRIIMIKNYSMLLVIPENDQLELMIMTVVVRKFSIMYDLTFHLHHCSCRSKYS